MKKYFAAVLGAALMTCNAFAVDLASDTKPTDLRTFGSKESQTVLYVFSSLTCPHCSVFHKDITPVLKQNYADTNMAKVVFVDMPFDPKAMTGTMIARCVAPVHYEPFMDTMYQNQSYWSRMPNARAIMTGYAKLLGESEQEINKCIVDKELQKKVSEQRNNLSGLYKVTGMPTLVAVKDGQSKKWVGTDKEIILNELNEFLGGTHDATNR